MDAWVQRNHAFYASLEKNFAAGARDGEKDPKLLKTVDYDLKIPPIPPLFQRVYATLPPLLEILHPQGGGVKTQGGVKT